MLFEIFRENNCLESAEHFPFWSHNVASHIISGMALVLRLGLSCIAGITMAACVDGAAQAPEVPIYKQGRREAQYEAEMGAAGKELFYSTNVVKFSAIAEQLKRTSCQLDLPKLNTASLT